MLLDLYVYITGFVMKTIYILNKLNVHFHQCYLIYLFYINNIVWQCIGEIVLCILSFF